MSLRLLFYGLFFGVASLHAQVVADRLDHIIPPSPEAAALTRAGSVGVSLYTGSASVQIPLWTLKGEVVSVPVYLSYHSNGLKVGEIPGWTGLGWTLHAGGVITRMVRGTADDLPTGYLTTGRNFLRVFPFVTQPFALWDPPGDGEEEKYQMLHKAAYNEIDLEPDLFSYNFNGHSGQFLLDTAGRPLLLSPDDLQITYTRDPGGKIISWTLTDDKGVTGIFGGEEAAEQTLFFTPNGSPSQQYYSAWHVTEITSPNGEDHFRFQYDERSEERRYPVSLKRSGCEYPSWDDLYKYSSTTIVEKHPKEIIQLFGDSAIRISFTSQVLERYPGGTITALRQVVVHHPRRQDLDRRFSLYYSFFPSTGCGTAQDYLRPCKRLRLDKITEEAGGIRKPPYMFFYDPQPLPPRGSFAKDYWGYYNGRKNESPVPAITVINADDHQSLIPPVGWAGAVNFDWFLQAHLNLTYAAEKVWKLPGADRRPDPEKAQAGILKRIVYPTGGTTLLEYEPNRAGYIMMPPPEKEVMIENNSFSPLSIDFTIDFDQEVRFIPLFFRKEEGREIMPYCNFKILSTDTGIPVDQEKEPVFYVDYQLFKERGGYDQEYRFRLKAGNYRLYAASDVNLTTVRGYLYYRDRTPKDSIYRIYSNDYEKTRVMAGFPHFPDDSSYTVIKDLVIGSEDDPVVRFSWYFFSRIAPNVVPASEVSHPFTMVWLEDLATGERLLEKFFPVIDTLLYKNEEGYYWRGSETMQLRPGHYRLVFQPRVSSEEGYISALYKKAVKTHPWALVGGVRLKRRIELDHNNDTALVKSYDYSTSIAGKQSWSSGVLMGVPLFWDEPEDFYYLGGTHIYDVNCFPLSVYSLARVEDPLTSGEHLGYAQVTERIPGNGRTVSFFTSPIDYPDISQLHFPFGPATSFDWKRGALKEKFIYSEDGRLRDHLVTQYNALHDSAFSMGMPSVKVVQKEPDNIYKCRYTVTLNRAGWNHPVRQDHWQYDTSGDHTFHTLQTYDYSPVHFRLQRRVTFTSDSQRLETCYRYPEDLPQDMPGIQALLDKHMTGVLLEEETLLDTVAVKGWRTFYGKHGDKVWPDSVQVLEGDTYRARTFFDRYDQQGRLLQYHRSGDVYHAVNRNIWGDPVIVADNATYDAAGTYPERAMVTRYAWDPLFGVSAVEDPNGNVTRYNYDPLGRLSLVRDPHGRIIQKMKYQYLLYQGDTARPVYVESMDRPSQAADTIYVSAADPVFHCPAVLTVGGGSLGTEAVWRWYRDGCAVTNVGTGPALTVYPNGRERYFVRAEGKMNNTRCKSITLLPHRPAFHPAKDTLFVGAKGTRHPVPLLSGYTGCDPWQTGTDRKWISVEKPEGAELTVSVAPNDSMQARTGKILLQASLAGGEIVVVQEGAAGSALALSLESSPQFITAGAEVTVTATAVNGTAPYIFRWVKKEDGDEAWSPLHDISTNSHTDQVSFIVGPSDVYVRCTLISNDETVSETLMIRPAI